MFPKIPVLKSPVELVGSRLVPLSDSDGNGTSTSELRAWYNYRTSDVPHCSYDFLTRIHSHDEYAPDEQGSPTNIGPDFLDEITKIVRLEPDSRDFDDTRFYPSTYAVKQDGTHIHFQDGVIRGSYKAPSGLSFIGRIEKKFIYSDYTLSGQVEDATSLAVLGISDLNSIVKAPRAVDSGYGYKDPDITYGGLNSGGQLATFATMGGTPASVSNVKRLLSWKTPVSDGSWVLYVDNNNTIRIAGSSTKFGVLADVEVNLVGTGVMPNGYTLGATVAVAYTDNQGGFHVCLGRSTGQIYDVDVPNGETITNILDGGDASPIIITNASTYVLFVNDNNPYDPKFSAITHLLPASPPSGVRKEDFIGGHAYLDGSVIRGAVLPDGYDFNVNFTQPVQRISTGNDIDISFSFENGFDMLGPADALNADPHVSGSMPPIYAGGEDYANDCLQTNWIRIPYEEGASPSHFINYGIVKFIGHIKSRYLLILPYKIGNPNAQV